DVVYFEYGTWFANYGTDLYAYDAGTGRLSTGHSGQDGINAITFNPAFPQVLYLGLVEVR
ncbi:MAG: dispase autolysis-inducing protein, partial [Hamadaea sp.]|nr:dispase autolysis-inducing protein [Hamadaea sp.]